MMRTTTRTIVLGMALAGLGGQARAAERSEIPEKYKWDLSHMYATPAAWAAAKEELARRIPGLDRFKGHLGESAAAFHQALSTVMDVDRSLSRLLAYASQLSDEDTRASKSMEKLQEAQELMVRYRTVTSYLRPEILALDEGKVRGFVATEPRLREYEPWIDDLLRWKSHTLSPAEERIVAMAGNFSDAGYDVHNIFTNADLPYPEVTLSTGETVRLDPSAYGRHRASAVREDRDKVFRAFWGRYREFARTLGTTLYSQVKAHVFGKDAHRFSSSVEAALFQYNIPASVYTQLLADVHANLPTLHRYLRLRKKMMGVDDLRYEDLYAPVVKRVDMRFTPEEATRLVLEACAPLGENYVRVLRRGFEDRWVDFFPSTGKRSGAYSNGVYGVHPYQLQNFTGLYDEVSTLAHECGHSLHSYLSNESQPYVTHDYSIFVAEVASTLNENLLLHHMLDRAEDNDTRLFLLGSYLDGMRTTLFRQTLFAEFELAIHEMVERGEALTGDALSALYLGLLKEYYGDAEGVCAVDDLYAVEWAYIPHFYYDFYVYQYATSLVASTSIAAAIREEASGPKPTTRARDAYLGMLSAGSSRYPIDLLKEAGVDMTTSAPFRAAMAEMNRIMDRIEEILVK